MIHENTQYLSDLGGCCGNKLSDSNASNGYFLGFQNAVLQNVIAQYEQSQNNQGNDTTSGTIANPITYQGQSGCQPPENPFHTQECEDWRKWHSCARRACCGGNRVCVGSSLSRCRATRDANHRQCLARVGAKAAANKIAQTQEEAQRAISEAGKRATAAENPHVELAKYGIIGASVLTAIYLVVRK